MQEEHCRNNVVTLLLQMSASFIIHSFNTYLNDCTIWINIFFFSPDQCGSVGWASSWKAKGRQFDSWSEHMSGLVVWSGSLGEGNQSMLVVSLLLFLPVFPLSKTCRSLPGVAQWIGFSPANPKDTGSTPIRTHCLDFCPPPVGGTKRQRTDGFFPLSPSVLLSKNK